ncbi:hypothetical protein JKF63_03719 [Porcisia hertigi]|uniref:Uncharacterized protein n=1 Tax=Porcisia hertigi TaxID=2761500 RepID=A0A836IR32_9TRYP|nr:hypothetical protein JKF63_03719 [Porcisia hertigi]
MSSPLLPQLRQPTSAKVATPVSIAVAAAPTSAAVCKEEISSTAPRHCSAAASSMSSSSCSTLSPVCVHTPAPPSTHRPAKAVPVSAQRLGGRKTAAVFQSKLQRLLWLDQHMTIVHNESQARSRTRCIEAEERAALWWQYRREGQQPQHTEDHSFRLEELQGAQVTPTRDVAPDSWVHRVECEEEAERRAIRVTAQEGLQLLYAGQHAQELQKTVRELVRQQWDAQEVQQGAEDVRALELKLAASSYRGLRAFQPDVDDLFDIAKGNHTSASAPPPPAPPPPPALAIDYEAPCEAKIREMYDRRTLVYEEAKERLFLDWWQGAAQLRFVEESGARQPFALWGYYVSSPACMRALVTVQRWWRMLRVAPWSGHRRTSLAGRLGKLPGYYSAERCRRYLRRLGGTASPENGEHTSAANDVSAALGALVAAATSPCRYRIQLDLYIYTVVQRAHALLASQPIQDAAVAAKIRASLRPPCTQNRYPLPYNSWRHHRWALYAEAHQLSVSALECAETSHRRCVEAEEATCSHYAAAFGVILHSGWLAVSDLQSRQVALAKNERMSRLRVAHQETYEYSVLRTTAAAVYTSPSICQAALSPQRCRLVHSGGQHEARAMASAARTPVTAHLEGDQKSLHANGSAPKSPFTEEDAWAQVQRCVLVAYDALAAAREESAQPKSLQRDRETDEGDAAASLEVAVSLYRSAFDEAAAAVYQSQYTAVRGRYVARYADALEQMRELFEVGLRERAVIIAAEARDLSQICHGDPSAQHVRRFELMQREAEGRADLEGAQGRVAAALYEALFHGFLVSQWVVGARKRSERSHRAATRARQGPALALPSLSSAERLISREAVCRTRLVCDCAAVLAEIIVQRFRLRHEVRYQNWVALCRRDGAKLDSAFHMNPPVAQIGMLGAEEKDGRLAICREQQVSAGRLLVEMHALYSSKVLWSDYLFGQLKLTSEAFHMDEQLCEYLRKRLVNVRLKTGELIQMEQTARSRVKYAEAITRDLRFHLRRLRLG